MSFLRKLFGSKKQDEPAPVAPAAPPHAEKVASGSSRAQVGWVSDVGKQRTTNEDSVLVVQASQEGNNALPPFTLLILADGMGGHQSGEVVSALAARSMARHIVQQVYLSALAHRDHGAQQPSIQETLVEGSNLANSTVNATVPGGGTTLVCALLLGSRAYLSNVGDSRAYLVASNGLQQISRDHSLVDRLVELGQLTAEEAASHPQKNVLYRAIGQSGVLEVDTFVHSIQPGEGLLLCSDGLWGMMSDEQMGQIIAAAASPQAACEALAVAANQAGGRDNISIVLVQFPDSS
ncbi:MAG: serine/threonine-protein phosphatase [Anaerolineae bacterium]|nr:serine/threonine-protein phosphatase [Anaerolineae bacterium]